MDMSRHLFTIGPGLLIKETEKRIKRNKLKHKRTTKENLIRTLRNFRTCCDSATCVSSQSTTTTNRTCAWHRDLAPCVQWMF
jgi:hypothetical protein